MESVSVSTEVLYPQRRRRDKLRSEYDLDFWGEVKKRWLVGGVLLAVLAAVLAPRAGAPGGNYMHAHSFIMILMESAVSGHKFIAIRERLADKLEMIRFDPYSVFHTEYLRYLPLSYVYYSAGRRGWARPPARLVGLCVLHAHVVAPALCVLTVEAFRGSGVDHRIVKGLVVSCCGGGCGWVCAGLAGGAGGALAAANYAAALLATPLLMLILCGRAAIPPLGGILSTILATVTPFAVGVLRRQSDTTDTPTCNNTNIKCNNITLSCKETPKCVDTTTKLSVLLLLYVDCCGSLTETEGSLYVGDVMVTLLLVLCWLASSVAACCLYARWGVGGKGGARLVAFCALPKCVDTGWESSSACSVSGLAGLPAALLLPAQALLLAGSGDD